MSLTNHLNDTLASAVKGIKASVTGGTAELQAHAKEWGEALLQCAQDVRDGKVSAADAYKLAQDAVLSAEMTLIAVGYRKHAEARKVLIGVAVGALQGLISTVTGVPIPVVNVAG